MASIKKLYVGSLKWHQDQVNQKIQFARINQFSFQMQMTAWMASKTKETLKSFVEGQE